MKPKANRVFVPILLLFAFAVVGLNTWLSFRDVDSLVQAKELNQAASVLLLGV